MRIEVTIAKTSPLPAGAIDALAGATKEDKQRISEILQETWESADDWFVSE